MKLVAGRVIVARLDGSLDFLELVSSPSQQGSCRARLISATSHDSLDSWSEVLPRVLAPGHLTDTRTCGSPGGPPPRLTQLPSLAWSCRAAGSSPAPRYYLLPGLSLCVQDHTIRVWRAEDGVAVYTLHGHTGPISSLFIDRLQVCRAHILLH